MTNDDDRFVITQYRVFGEQHTTISCPRHQHELLAGLRKAGIGSGSTFAPWLMSCDRCENTKEAQP